VRGKIGVGCTDIAIRIIFAADGIRRLVMDELGVTRFMMSGRRPSRSRARLAGWESAGFFYHH